MTSRPERTVGKGAPKPLGRVELTSLLAMSMALAALGIDLLLPAFPEIRAHFGLPADSTAVAGTITAYFFGLAAGQLFYGPLADRFGRRPTLYVGYVVYALGALASALAPSLTVLYASRLLWGLGAAGCRVITIAVIRDRYEGEAMSRAMSFVMAVFILVPIVAPTIGAGIVAVASWRWIFASCLLAVAVLAVWALRLPETLREEYRRDLEFGRVMAAARIVVTNRQTVAYTLAMTSLYAAFASYLASSEIIFGEVFGAADAFPIIFGALAAVMGVAMLLNARIVRTVGTRRLGHGVMFAYVVVAASLVAVAFATDGRPPLWAFLGVLGVILSAHALLIPNFNTISMDPMAEVAGTASSVIGAVQISVGALLGAVIDRAFDGTIRPLSLGFLASGIGAVLLVLWGERGALFAPLKPRSPQAAATPPPITPS